MPSYLSFARFYDGLMQDACYEKRCDYILKLAESFGHDMGITLDLACGTGTLTRLLKKRGVDVFGMDYSMEMLSEAMQSASEEGLDILFLRQKMQSIDLYGTINTCVCTLAHFNQEEFKLNLEELKMLQRHLTVWDFLWTMTVCLFLMSTRCTSIKMFLRIIPLCMKTTAFSAYGKTLPKMITR